MNNDEAKFILRAYRPEGRDAADPAFADALAQAERDPDLRAWFENERRLDQAVAAKLPQLAPPPGLREAILAGGRVSAARTDRAWWKHPRWVALAAAAAVVALIGSLLFLRRAPVSLPSGAQLIAFALRDTADAHDQHDGFPAGLSGLQAQLAAAPLPLTRGPAVDVEQLRAARCRSVTVGGCQLFEICFHRDGAWYHLYVGRRSDVSRETIDPRRQLLVQGEYASTAWANGDLVYILVTDAGADALKRLI